METVLLSRIVRRLTPELYSALTPEELETRIVLRDGLDRLDVDDAAMIVKYSICEHQKGALLH